MRTVWTGLESVCRMARLDKNSMVLRGLFVVVDLKYSIIA